MPFTETGGSALCALLILGVNLLHFIICMHSIFTTDFSTSLFCSTLMNLLILLWSSLKANDTQETTALDIKSNEQGSILLACGLVTGVYGKIFLITFGMLLGTCVIFVYYSTINRVPTFVFKLFFSLLGIVSFMLLTAFFTEIKNSFQISNPLFSFTEVKESGIRPTSIIFCYLGLFSYCFKIISGEQYFTSYAYALKINVLIVYLILLKYNICKAFGILIFTDGNQDTLQKAYLSTENDVALFPIIFGMFLGAAIINVYLKRRTILPPFVYKFSLSLFGILEFLYLTASVTTLKECLFTKHKDQMLLA